MYFPDLLFRPAEVELWAPAISRESAAGKLLTRLSTQGMLVRELIDKLDELGIDTFKLGLSQYGRVIFSYALFLPRKYFYLLFEW